MFGSRAVRLVPMSDFEFTWPEGAGHTVRSFYIFFINPLWIQGRKPCAWMRLCVEQLRREELDCIGRERGGPATWRFTDGMGYFYQIDSRIGQALWNMKIHSTRTRWATE